MSRLQSKSLRWIDRCSKHDSVRDDDALQHDILADKQPKVVTSWLFVITK